MTAKPLTHSELQYNPRSKIERGLYYKRMIISGLAVTPISQNGKPDPEQNLHGTESVPGTTIVRNTTMKILMNVSGGEVCSETLSQNGEPPHHL